jgi:4-hydroxy-2-oxoheptanedioate aldolase
MFAPHSMPGMKPADYDDWADKGLMVVVQIESRAGVENVEKIAKVDGVDVLFIGRLATSHLLLHQECEL